MDLRYLRVGTALAVLLSGAAGMTGVPGVRAEADNPSPTEQGSAAPAAPAAAAAGFTPRGVADVAALGEADHSSAVFLVDGVTPAVYILRTPASLEPGKAVELSAFATLASDPSWGRPSAPSSLALSGRSLIVSDAGGRVMAQLFVPPPSPKMPYVADASPRVVQPPSKPPIPAGLKGLPSFIQDFDVHRGVYYIAGKSGLFTAAPENNLVLPIKIDDGISDDGVKVAVSSVHLVVGDGPKRRVHIYPRPVPTVVSLEADAAASSVQLLNLYDFLQSRELLPLRTHSVSNPLTLEETLVAERVLLAPVAGGANVEPALLKRITCLLSPQACPRKGNATLSVPLKAGDILRLPDLAIEEAPTTSLINLGGRSVREHLDERVLDPKQRGRIDREYLTRINPGAAYSLEDRLTRLGFTVATPWRPELTPLTFVQVKDGREELLPGLAAECKLTPEHVPITVSNTPLGEFERGSPSRYLKAYVPDAHVRGKIGADETLVAFEDLGIDQVNLKELRTRLADSDVADCLEDKVPEGAGLIIRSLRASRLLFKQPRDASYKQAGPHSPTVLAYQLAPWEDIAKARAADVRHVALSPWDVKPGSDQDPFERRIGVVTLPITRWQLKMLVPARDLTDPQSAIRRFEDASKGFHVLSSQSVVIKSSASDVNCDPATRAVDPDTEKLLMEARRQFIKAIKYDDAFASQVLETIGLGEEGPSVDREHPAFLDSSKRSAWLRAVDEFGLEPYVVAASANKTPAASVKRFCRPTDHGTHIAGLLAARTTGPVAGLLPSASLFLIDTKSELGLYNAIKDAKDRGIYLFNFSFTMPHDPSFITLRKKLREEWWDLIFIVAAGNEGRNLADGADPLIGWSPDIGHIIGVGAADAAGMNVLGEWPDEDNRMRDGSNFGPQYVQLVAPGHNIYGLARDNAYALATGSSQAVPQVTAAAAILFAQRVIEPRRIKARLIYTTDWRSAFDKQVWGGLLNVHRAVWMHDRHLLWTQSAKTVAKSLRVTGNRIVKIKSAESYEPNGEPVATPPSIPFQRVLRMTLTGGSQYRIWYLDENSKLHVLHDAVIDGELLCQDLEQWDATTKQFMRTEETQKTCKLPIQVTSIFDYVAASTAVPPSVRFR